MKIASVGYDPRLKFIGGAPTAAVAFKRWCDELDHDAHLITFTGSGLPSDDDLLFLWGVEYEHHKWADFVDVLDDFDFVYFSSPMGIMYKRKEQQFYVEKYEQLSVPFAIHIHGEYDERYYDIDKVKDILSLGCCVALVVMYNGFWDHLAEPWGMPCLPFHPCTLPEYTIGAGRGIPIFENRKQGLLFAHRFSSVKRPKQLAEMTHVEPVMELLDNRVTAHGVASGQNLMWERDQVDPIDPKWDRRKQYHNIYDFERYSALLLDHKHFWNVSGSVRTKYKLKRLDLTGFEAVSMGCIPWVNKDYCPDWLKKHAVLVDIEPPYNWERVYDQINYIEDRYTEYILELESAITNSDCSYYGVKDKVKEILKCSES
jgi:hypothetical protein